MMGFLAPRRITLIAAAFLALLTACGSQRDQSSGNAASAKTLTIAVIPKGTTHEFWKSIHAGAIQATQELASQGVRVNLIWKGPLREDDRAQQIDVVEGFLSQ